MEACKDSRKSHLSPTQRSIRHSAYHKIEIIVVDLKESLFSFFVFVIRREICGPPKCWVKKFYTTSNKFVKEITMYHYPFDTLLPRLKIKALVDDEKEKESTFYSSWRCKLHPIGDSFSMPGRKWVATLSNLTRLPSFASVAHREVNSTLKCIFIPAKQINSFLLFDGVKCR